MKTIRTMIFTALLLVGGAELVVGALEYGILKNNRMFSIVTTDSRCAVAIGEKSDVHAMMQMAGYER